MPSVEVRVYRSPNRDSTSEIQEWLEALEQHDQKAYAKCLWLILQLEEQGNAMRRPLSDALAEGVRELRARVGRVNYRILYFFAGPGIAVLSHGLTKEGEVPQKDIKKAIARRKILTRSTEALNEFTNEFNIG